MRWVVAEHQAGAANHTERVWALVNFEMWLRQFIDGESACEPEVELAETALAKS
jgi:hypothetical protein